MKVVGVLLCAGRSERMGFDKLTHMLPGGETPISRSAKALQAGGVEELILVANQATAPYALAAGEETGLPCQVVTGGAERQDSVYQGLLHAQGAQIVVIHDAARCLVEPAIVSSSIHSAQRYGSGIAAIPAQDTVLRQGAQGISSLPRQELLCMQTPQTFCYEQILQAYEQGRRQGLQVTDDCALYLAAGYIPHFVAGSPKNRKLTTPEDFLWLNSCLPSPWTEGLEALAPSCRCKGYALGCGEDVHLLTPGRKLILGGVSIPYEKGLLGHSDADVLAHAITDAILGAACLGDIGRLFPDTDAAYAGVSSLLLLTRAMSRVTQAGFRLSNVDATIVAQRPKLAPHIPFMQQNLAQALSCSPEQVSIKATTTEGMGPEGKGLCMRATAVALLSREDRCPGNQPC